MVYTYLSDYYMDMARATPHMNDDYMGQHAVQTACTENRVQNGMYSVFCVNL